MHGAARGRGSRSSSPRTCTTRGSSPRSTAATRSSGGPAWTETRSTARNASSPNATWPPPSNWPPAAARVEALERIQDVRADWLDRTREVQERAAFAGDELERRGLDRDTADPVGEQQELFTTGNAEPAGEAAAGAAAEVAAGVASDADTATSAAQTMRGLDPAQRQFDLDGVAPVVPATTASERAATEHQTTERQTGGHETTASAGRSAEPSLNDAQQAGAEPVLGGPAAVPVQQAEAAPDGYAELFAETERAVEREREQPTLFEVQPTPVDVAAAQPLHLDESPSDAAGGRAVDTTAERTEDEAAVEDASLTVSQSTRQAEIIAEMRAELDARAGTAAGAPLPRAADPDDEDLDLGASGDDVDARTDVEQGQGLST
jgi:hypothetical protein